VAITISTHAKTLSVSHHIAEVPWTALFSVLRVRTPLLHTRFFEDKDLHAAIQLGPLGWTRRDQHSFPVVNSRLDYRLELHPRCQRKLGVPMPTGKRTTSGGGKGTTSGTTFQEDVAAYFCVLVLAENDVHPIAGLPAEARLTDVFCEGPHPVDDLAARNSAGGRIFVQAKTSLSLSPNEDSELATVIDQFARQIIAGDRGPDHTTRELALDRDRVVLAVGPDTPATVTDTLCGILNAFRNASTPSHQAEIEAGFNQQQRNVLQIVRAHVGRSWHMHQGRDITAEEELLTLRLMHVVQFDFRPDGATTNRAHDVLRRLVAAPETASKAWDSVVTIARDFGPERKGGDAEFLRAELQRRGVDLASAPSYRNDIANLKAYTLRRLATLREHAVMPLGGQSLKIKRDATSDLVQFAINADVAVTGEPGAGKSGVLHDVCVSLLGNADLVVLVADDLNAASRESLAVDLGIARGRGLADVLANWAGPGQGYLVVDALDVAARAGISLRVLCSLIREVRERASRWRIIIAMREYDLRSSVQVQELFRGTPHPTRRDERFPQTRHLKVDRLHHDELAQLDGTRVASVLASASHKLRELLANPFNLSLLCNLLDRNVTTAELGQVETQVGLLDLYWRHRIETTDLTNREATLAAVVEVMIEGRAMQADRLKLATRAGATTASLDALLQDGILVDYAIMPGVFRLSFPHNILFDYAAARLWAGVIDDALIASLATPARQDLLLAMRPSLVMAFERLWLKEASRQGFWTRAIAVQQNSCMRAVGKVIAAGVAAAHFRTVSDVGELLGQIGNEREPAAAILHSFVTAALSQHSAVIGDGAAEWMGLAALLASRPEVYAWDVKRLLWTLPRSGIEPTRGQARQANAAARTLIKHGLSDPHRYGMVCTGLEVAAQTISADPIGTVASLSMVLEPAHFRACGHEWLHPLAERLGIISASDPAFAIYISEVAFSSSASREEQVPLGGRILGLTLNKHDMLAMARHDISKVFPELFLRDPANGTRLLIGIMVSVIATEHPQFAQQRSTYSTAFRNGSAKFRPDGSYIWSMAEHARHEDWWKILDCFERGLVQFAHSRNTAAIDTVLDVLRDENQLCVVWNRLLVAAAMMPESLGQRCAELLASTFVLGHSDMRSFAGELLRASYKHLSRTERAAIESAIQGIPNDIQEHSQDTAERRKHSVLRCLPGDLITNEELRLLHDTLERTDAPAVHDPDLSLSQRLGELDEHWWLRRAGVSPSRPANAVLLSLKKPVESIPESTAEEPLCAEAAEGHAATIRALEQALAEAAGADRPLIEDCRSTIIAACQRLASARGLERDMEVTGFLRSQLLAGAEAERPLANPEEDARWDREAAGWQCPAPRVDAAIGLRRLAARPETVGESILAALERLSRDVVPAVRYQVLAHVHTLAHTAPVLMWRIIEERAASEPCAGILGALAHDVLLSLPRDREGRQSRVARVLNRRGRRFVASGNVRRAVANFYALAAIYEQDSRAERYLRVIASNPCTHDEEANRIIDMCRLFMRFEDAGEPQEYSRRIRISAFGFLASLVCSVRRDIESIRARHATTSGGSAGISEADLAQLRTAYRLVHSVAIELYFASGADNHGEQFGEETEPRPALSTEQQKSRFFNEATPLLQEMCTLDVVEAAYEVLKTLRFFVDVAPKQSLLLIAGLLRRSAADGIQYETLAADLAVEIVESYLSEHALMLRSDAEAQSALLDALDIFVVVGWPSATRLAYRLEDVFR
jgi:hypothetical protein